MFLDPTYKCYHVLLVFELLHLVWSYLGPSMLLQMALFHFFYGWIIAYKRFGHDLATEQQQPHLLTLSVLTPCLSCVFSSCLSSVWWVVSKITGVLFLRKQKEEKGVSCILPEILSVWEFLFPLPCPQNCLTATCNITSFASDQKSEKKWAVNVIVLFFLHGSL